MGWGAFFWDMLTGLAVGVQCDRVIVLREQARSHILERAPLWE